MATATAPAHRETAGAETPTLKRDFTLWSAFSLAFAYISPIVATYGVFALALPLVGPGYWLLIPIAVVGQLLVALVLGEVASRHPLEGSLYAWAGRLLGPAYGVVHRLGIHVDRPDRARHGRGRRHPVLGRGAEHRRRRQVFADHRLR